MTLKKKTDRQFDPSPEVREAARETTAMKPIPIERIKKEMTAAKEIPAKAQAVEPAAQQTVHLGDRPTTKRKRGNSIFRKRKRRELSKVTDSIKEVLGCHLKEAESTEYRVQRILRVSAG